ncbi:MAG: hypothetical protein DI539_15145 [Flavobacterium psychrophilum]|nr:MAG: hypothetical protein DI539_15145 [Flavobacterium psychrophilum]
MTTIIRFRVKKDIDPVTARKILKLKGNLIAQSFTDIIHFDDDGEEFYIHYFTISSERKLDVITYTSSFIADEVLTDAVTVL